MDASPTALAAFMREHQEEILHVWESRAKHLARERPLSLLALRDEVRFILQRLADSLDRTRSGDSPADGDDVSLAAAEHVLAEAMALREIIEVVWPAGDRPEAKDALRLLGTAIERLVIPFGERFSQGRLTLLEAMDALVQAMADGTVEQQLTDTLRVLVRGMDGIDLAAVMLVDSGWLRMRAAVGVGANALLGSALQIGRGLEGIVAVEQIPRSINSVPTNPLVTLEALRRTGVSRIYCVPITHPTEGERKLLGVAYMATLGPRDFSDQAKSLFRALIARAAGVIHRAVVREQLELEQARFEALGENAPFVVFSKDVSLRYVSVNGLAGEQVGLVPGLLLGKTGDEVLPAEFAARMRATDEEVLRRRVTIELEDVLTRGPESRVFRIVKYSIFDAEGQLVGVGGIASDITDLKNAERRARESEAKYGALVDIAANMVWTAEADGSLTPDCAAFRAITGQTFDKLMGFGWLEAVHPDDRQGVEQRFRDAVASQRKFSVQLRLRDASGAWRWVAIRAAPLRDERGPVRKWVGMNADVDDEVRRELHQKLLARASSALLSSTDYDEALAEAARVVVPDLADCSILDMVDDDGTVRRVQVVHRNEGKAALAERLREIHIDRSKPHLLDAALRADKAVLVRSLPDAYIESFPQSDEYRALLRELRPTSIILVPLRARDRLVGSWGFVQCDAEMTGRYAHLDLEAAKAIGRIAALAIDNARLYRAARRAVEMRDEILRVVVHDLRTPLGTVLAGAQSLERALPEGAARERRVIEAMAHAARHMNDLASGLLDHTTLEAGQLSIARERASPAALIERAAREMQPQLERASMMLDVAVSRDLPDVLADPTRIEQVFENLIGNAIKFSRPGTCIALGATSNGAGVAFFVRDQGAGISREDQEHIFDRFWQGRRADHRGAGLGLAICKGIVTAHGGRMWVESTPGQGSTFHFSLPTAEAGERLRLAG